MRRLHSSSRPGMGRNGSLMSQLCVEKDRRSCGGGQEEVSTILKSEETDSDYMQWTDEKHSLYLNSMEASFVNELYDSLGGSHQKHSSEPKVSSRHKQNGVSAPSGQFKVFKGGYWERVNFNNFRREMVGPKKAEKSDHILANPWIQHYRSLGRHQTKISPSLQKQAPASTTVDSSAFQFRSQNSTGITTEGTDQNFSDEVPEEQNPSTIHRQKCRKLSEASGLSHDQVVPFAKLSLKDNIVNASPN